ncbi:MAG TPA: sulfatase [Candidatus Lokiarchaeia archaeon]|nr:sulfatase [Candidatus Lokiarchaeia archaeon]
MSSDPTSPMNFIVIISDTLRRDFLSCYGNDWVYTEHIQQFADRALVFDNAYSASFPTVPHRHDVFTGNYTATYMPWAPLPEIEAVVQTLLQPWGYTSMMVCDEPHILENGYHYDRGFDGFEWVRGQEGDRWKTTPKAPPYRCDPKKMRDPERLQRCHMRTRAHWQGEEDTFPARTATTTCEWLEENYQDNPDAPFYLYVDFFDPHEPWDAPQELVDLYDPGYSGDVVDYPQYAKVDSFLTPAELEHCRALYAAEVTLVDRWVGRIFEKVQNLGLFDNTLVIFTTDHGFLHGEHGFIGKSLIRSDLYRGTLNYLPLFEEICHIPLIVAMPGGATGRTPAMVQPPDFMPTILDLAGHPWTNCDGRSFAGVLRGETDTHRDYALSFPYLRGGGIPITITRGDWSAVFFSQVTPGGTEKIVDKAVDGVAKVQEPWEEAQDLLFNIREDPRQLTNLAFDNPGELESLREMLISALRKFDVEPDIFNGWAK